MLKHGLFVFGLAAAFSSFFLPIENPDLHWHLSAAKYISAHHKLPTEDFLSWTNNGKPWVDFEWLPQLAYYGLYSAGGFWALAAFKACLLSGALALFCLLLRLYGMGRVIFLAAPLWAAGLLPSLDLRPDNFTLLFFSAELYLLEKFRLRRLSWSFPGLMARCALFFALWANLHAGFLYGLALLAMYAFGEFVPAILPYIYDKERNVPFRNTLLLAAGLAAGTAGSLLNAYGWKIYSVALQHRELLGKLQEFIAEWQQPTFDNPYQWPYWGLTLMAFVVLLFRFIKTRDISYAHLAAILYFGLSSSCYSRHSLFMVLCAVPYTIYMLSDLSWTGWRLKAAAAGCGIFFMATLWYYNWIIWPHAARLAWSGKHAPQGAAAFLNQNAGELKKLKMYNPWAWGGYLGYALNPEYRVFVDGRYIFHSYLEEMDSAAKDNQSWGRFAEKYAFDIILAQRTRYKFRIEKPSKDGKKDGLWRPLYLVFMPRASWALVYWDGQAMVFIRRTAVSKKWLESHEFSLVRADDLPAAGMLVLEGERGPGKVKKEVFMYLRGPHGTGDYDAGPEVLVWWRRLQKLLREKSKSGSLP